MLTESKAASSPAPRTLKVSVSGDTMQIDQTNVTINIDDDNPFEGSKHNEPHTEDIEDTLRQIEEEKRLLEEEKRKVEEAKQKFLEDEIKKKRRGRKENSSQRRNEKENRRR